MGRVFPDEVTYHGVIVEYTKKKRWWKIKHDEDGDAEELNFRELCKMEHPPDFSAFRYAADGIILYTHTKACADAHTTPPPTPLIFFHSITPPPGPAASTCTETVSLVKDNTEEADNDPVDNIWDMEGEEWRLINVFALEGGKKYVAAYCPSTDFVESMLEQSRKSLVVSHATVEVALLTDIKTWIEASNEIRNIQEATENGERPKRRRITTVPRRKVKMVKKWNRAHDSACGFCDKKGKGMSKCYGCNVVAHKKCADQDGQCNVLSLPNKTIRWVCDACYFDAHGGGE